MTISKMKVGTRLFAGFAVLLASCAAIGLLAVEKMGVMNAGAQRMATEDWREVRAANSLENDVRSIIADFGELLLARGEDFEALRQRIVATRAHLKETYEFLDRSLKDPRARAVFQKFIAARSAQVASVERVLKLANDSKTHAEAVEIYRTETRPLAAASINLARELIEDLAADFDESARRSADLSNAGRGQVLTILAATMIAGMVLAIVLARSIVRPLRMAVDVAEAVERGKLDNIFDSAGRDETGQLLRSLDKMQIALRARDEKDADSRGQIAAIGKSQAVIEYDLQGNVLCANDNFLKTMGYSLDEIRGRHHRLFVEPAFANSSDYRKFWDDLARGHYASGQYKRVAKGGREVWLQASYNPITDASGKPVKVVKYATDITEQMVRNADQQGQLAAIDKAQAVIEFDMDGTVRKVNDNFAGVMGYSPAEVIGRHHSMFIESSAAASPDYRAFWAKLNRGEPDAGRYMRLAKGGREVWMQASYNPIPDANGKPFKVVKYATDVTAAEHMQQELRVAVKETQDTVQRAANGDLTRRIPMSGKTGDLEVLCASVNSLLDSTTELVKRVKTATGEVQQGAEEISRGNTNLSQRTEQQASSLEETASSMEEMTSTVKETADNAGKADQLAMAARQQAERGGEVVSNAVSAMAGINEASRKIADIIGVIDEIAFQTNLLALNAAVEAARAGEQGRGFAVVATEVRSLASRSASAAKEIKTLIQDSVAKVEQGSKLVDESGKTLSQIVTAVKKVTDIVAEIAAASREQSTGIEQVNKAVMQMDTTTQQNAALVEEASAASQSIVEQAQALNSLISRYDVGSGEPAAQSEPVVERRGRERPWAAQGGAKLRAV